MSDAAANKKVVAEFLEVFSTGDTDRAMAFLDDSATWWVAGKIEGLSGTKDKATFAQVHAGAKAMMKSPLRLSPIAWTAEGDRVAVEMESYAELLSGAVYENVYHTLFEVRDGKIQSVREYPDTDTIRAVFLAS